MPDAHRHPVSDPSAASQRPDSQAPTAPGTLSPPSPQQPAPAQGSAPLRPAATIAIALAAFLLIFALLIPVPVYNDDAFITLRYARNLAERGEIAYNPGERVLGTTSPLLMGVVALPAAFGADPLWAVRLLSAAAMGGAGILLLALFTRRWGLAGAATAVAAFALHPLIRAVWGNELPLFYFLLLLSLFLFERGRLAWAGLCAGLLYLARGEGLLLCAVLPGLLILRQGAWRSGERLRAALPPLARLLAPALLVIGLWSLFAWHYFGSPLPNTLGRKIMQGRISALWCSYLQGAWQMLAAHLTGGLFPCLRWLFPAVFIVGVLAILVKSARCAILQALLAFALLQNAGYALLKVPGNYWWYYHALFLLEALAAGACVHLLGQAVLKFRPCSTRAALAAQAILMFALAGSFLKPVTFPGLAQRYEIYQRTATRLRSRILSQSVILCQEVGIFGYDLPCRVYDTFGLIHNRLPRTGDPFSFQENLPNFEPDLLIVNYPIQNHTLGYVKQGRPVLYHEVERILDPAASTVVFQRAPRP